MKLGASFLLAATLTAAPVAACAQATDAAAWKFAVSGDSRNCGDVVMPAIARGVHADEARFYLHLGDFRALYDVDEDILAQEPYRSGKRPGITTYNAMAWDDFILHQLLPFGSTPVYLGTGNHELVPPHTREQYLIQFADWINTPELQTQRLNDDGFDHKIHAYYHFLKGPVDFILLDNASPDQFDADQMKWLKGVLDRDLNSQQVKSVVLGMHEALPQSVGSIHAMDDSAQGKESGAEVYKLLLNLRDNGHKNVYVLASHSHYFLEHAFETDELRKLSKPLDGWIVGTAGANRYLLPDAALENPTNREHVYGYLLGTVAPDATISFQYRELGLKELQEANPGTFTDEFVATCFNGNGAARKK